MSLTLATALRASGSHSIAFVGSGGKTTAIFQLARQLNSPAIVTATTHLGIWQISLADKHIFASKGMISKVEKDLGGVSLITGEVEGDRTKPIEAEALNRIREFCTNHSIPLLIEADGARQRPLKAWADHEPPIPDFVDHVVQVAGLSGLGKPLTEEFVHRPEIFSRLSGLENGELITEEALVRLLTHPQGAMKNIPKKARRTILLNQAGTQKLQSAARSMAQSLLPAHQAVVIANLEQQAIYAVHEPIAGVILAAGGSVRYGQPKQLLDWKGEPFVRVVAKKALRAGLWPVVLILGANSAEIEAAVQGIDVQIIVNQDWKSGQASSIKSGVSLLLSDDRYATGGAMFLLTDQPQITTSVFEALVEKHAEGLYPITAPMVIDRRANPVLFDQSTFPELLTLQGDIGGRAIFHRFPVEYLPWHDDRLLLDVDTPENYQRLLADETL